MNSVKLKGFSLAEMMIVLLILTIIIMASIPLITKRTQNSPRVVEKIIKIEMPTMENGDFIIQDNHNQQNSQSANQVQSEVPARDMNVNVKDIQMTQIETEDGDIITQPVITVEGGKKYTVTYEDGKPKLKVLEQLQYEQN